MHVGAKWTCSWCWCTGIEQYTRSIFLANIQVLCSLCMRTSRRHGLPEDAVHAVCKAIVVAKVTNASSACSAWTLKYDWSRSNWSVSLSFREPRLYRTVSFNAIFNYADDELPITVGWLSCVTINNFVSSTSSDSCIISPCLLDRTISTSDSLTCNSSSSTHEH